MPLLTPQLTVDLNALVENYRRLQAQFSGTSVAAVVKADAYGLGAAPVARALITAGCRLLFVASLEEALRLRAALPEWEAAGIAPSASPCPIAVFQGPFPGEEAEYLAHGITPVLNHAAQWERWHRHGRGAPAFVHLDSGMTRLGFQEAELAALTQSPLFAPAEGGVNVALLLSHLACASTPNDPKNLGQWQRLQAMAAHFPGVPVSFANSAGVFLPPALHADIARPGCALYGITPNADAPNPMRHVATLSAPILQLRRLEREETVGYGAACTMPAGSVLATVALGYADGWLRSLSHQSVGGILGQYRLPQCGRVSMDMVVLDVTNVPEALLQPGTMVDFICPAQDVNAVAEAAGTIGYEIFTRLGRRVRREYVPLAMPRGSS